MHLPVASCHKIILLSCLVLAWMAFIIAMPDADAQQTDQAVATDEAAATSPEAATPKLVAVIHLTSYGVNTKTADGEIEDTLQSGLLQSGQRGISKQETQTFLASDAGKPFVSCYSMECSVQAGRGLGADWVLTGDIRKKGDQVRISLIMLDANSGTVLGKKSQEIPADMTLDEPLKTAVQELALSVTPQQQPMEVDAIPVGEVAEGVTEGEQQAKEERFYKGELTTIGPLEIIPLNDRAGVVLGYRRLGFNHYAHIEPQVDLRFFPDDITKDSKLRLGFGIPLNLQIFSGEDQDDNGKLDKFDIKIRSEDWDNWRDFFQVIRYIQFGRKEDNLYLNINRVYAASLGHGIIMKRYLPNLDYFQTRVSGEFDAYSKYGGVELYTNDITRANIVGGLFFLKPGSFFSDSWMAESFSLGFTYMTDWDAPNTVVSNRRNSDNSYIYDSTDIHFFGVDAELKVVRWPVEQPKVDVKVYADYTKWLHNGAGVSLGLLGRFNLYSKIRQAMRLRVEFRTFQDNYTPSYFDSFYEIAKFKWFSQNKPANNKSTTDYTATSKYLEFHNRPSDWEHFGAYVEFSYALLDYVGFTLAFDGANGKDNGNFLLHLEIPATKYFQISATYYKVNVDSAKNVFDPTADNTMFIALARLRPVQLLSFQFGIRKTVQPSARYFPNLESVWDVKADLDLSWEF